MSFDVIIPMGRFDFLPLGAKKEGPPEAPLYYTAHGEMEVSEVQIISVSMFLVFVLGGWRAVASRVGNRPYGILRPVSFNRFPWCIFDAASVLRVIRGRRRGSPRDVVAWPTPPNCVCTMIYRGVLKL